jgi:hypothetical protein
VIKSLPSLVGTIPSKLTQLIYLNTIYVWGNPGLSGTIPALGSKLAIDAYAVASLPVSPPSEVRIDLSENNLTGTIPPFAGVPLTFLNLVGNRY